MAGGPIMILGEREVRWQLRVESCAIEHGWTVYEQSPARRRGVRPAEPSLVLLRGAVVLLVYLRTTGPRPGRRPPVEKRAAATGVRVAMWTPAEWSAVVAVLAAVPEMSLATGQFPQPGAAASDTTSEGGTR